MDKLKLIEAILNSSCGAGEQLPSSGRASTLLEIGKPYLFRTVTMIYTGRLKAYNEQEFLVTEAAWIPDTERWMDAVTKSAFKEVEPYPSDKSVLIGRGGILDVCEIPSLPKNQI